MIPASEHKAAERQYEGQRLRYEAARQDLEAAQDKVGADAVRVARLRLESAETRMQRLEETRKSALVRAPVSGSFSSPAARADRDPARTARGAR